MPLRVRPEQLVLPAGILASLLVMLVPLPAGWMDFLLIANMAVSVVILLTALSVSSPLEFSIFPTLLLATTMGRLTVNIATTRLILTRAPYDGMRAAGGVVERFGQFVAGDQLLVGIVIFSIVAVIQFVVITKGATRIGEVAARFALDGMPGRQMAIDADLNAGVIDGAEAQRRRSSLAQQADFYGAMDGASKFVRGDAIAGVVITLINLLGGLGLGVLYHGMSATVALDTFARLTIGDGLASQLPALLIALAAGLLIARSSQASNLSREMAGQLMAHPQALVIAACFLGLLVLTSLPAIPLLTMAGVCVALAVRKSSRGAAASAAPRPAKTATPAAAPHEKRIEDMLRIDPVEVEVGLAWVRLVQSSAGPALLERINRVRQSLAQDLGIILPKVRVRDNLRLPESCYRIAIHGTVWTMCDLEPHDVVAVARTPSAAVRAPAFPDPTVFPWGAYILKQPESESLDPSQYQLMNAAGALVEHLHHIVSAHADELLTRDATRQLVAQVRAHSPAVVDELIPDVLKLSQLQRILRELLRERVSIRQLALILETVGDQSETGRQLFDMIEAIRLRLSRSLCAQYRDSNHRLHVVTLSTSLERRITAAVDLNGQRPMIRLPQADVDQICQVIGGELESLRRAGRPCVALVHSTARRAVKELTRSAQHDLSVLAYSEITPDTKVVTVGIVADPFQEVAG